MSARAHHAVVQALTGAVAQRVVRQKGSALAVQDVGVAELILAAVGVAATVVMPVNKDIVKSS